MKRYNEELMSAWLYWTAWASNEGFDCIGMISEIESNIKKIQDILNHEE